MLPLNRVWAMETTAFAAMFEKMRGLSVAEAKSLFSPEDDSGDIRDLYDTAGRVATIQLRGVVTKNPSWLQVLFGLAGFATKQAGTAIRAALDDSNVDSILLVIESPGGCVSGTAELADLVRAANQRKPVWAYAEDLCCSAAYWIASQADRLYVNSTAEIANIGVYTVVADYSRMAEAEGVKFNIVRSGDYKGVGTFGVAVTDAQLTDIQRNIDSINDLFVGAVAAGRGMRRKYHTKAAGEPVSAIKAVPDDGRVFVGQEAVDLGLADGVYSLSDVLAHMQGQPVGSLVGLEEMDPAVPDGVDIEVSPDDAAPGIDGASDGSRTSDSQKSVPRLTRWGRNRSTKEENEMNMNQIKSALGAPPDASEADLLAMLSSSTRKASEVDELRAELDAVKKKSDENATSAANAAIEAEVTRRLADAQKTEQIKAMVDDLEKRGIVTPAMRAATVAGQPVDAALALATANPEAFAAFAAELKPIAPVAAVFADAGQEEAVDAGVPAGSFADKDYTDAKVAEALHKACQNYAEKNGVSYTVAYKALITKREN